MNDEHFVFHHPRAVAAERTLWVAASWVAFTLLVLTVLLATPANLPSTPEPVGVVCAKTPATCFAVLPDWAAALRTGATQADATSRRVAVEVIRDPSAHEARVLRELDYSRFPALRNALFAELEAKDAARSIDWYRQTREGRLVIGGRVAALFGAGLGLGLFIVAGLLRRRWRARTVVVGHHRVQFDGRIELFEHLQPDRLASVRIWAHRDGHRGDLEGLSAALEARSRAAGSKADSGGRQALATLQQVASDS